MDGALSLNISAPASTDTAVLSGKKTKKLSWKEKKKLVRERKSKKSKPRSTEGVVHFEQKAPTQRLQNQDGVPQKKKLKTNQDSSPHKDHRHASALDTQHHSATTPVASKPPEKESDSVYVPITSSLFTSNPRVPEIPLLPEVEEAEDMLYALKNFSDLPLAPHLISNIQQNFGFSTMTRVQSLAIPEMVTSDSWRDVLVKSKTGTGKTLAYAVPILQDLQGIVPKISRSDGPYAIVLTPTRELAQQTYGVFQLLAKSFTWVVPGCIVGGEKRKSEKARIRKGLNIIIATPGRLVDHFENTASLGVSRVKWLVLDEADRLMEMGFSANVHTIVSLLDREKVLERRRRNVLLSATLSKAVTELSGSTLHKPLFIDASTAESGKVGSETRGGGPPSAVSQTPSQLDQYCVVVPAKLRLVCLAACLKQLCFESKQKVIVFMISKRSVEFHHHLYSNALDEDLPLYELHGSMDQEERRRVHKSFSQTTTGALLCTDVAARGLDLPEVDWIIQHSPPCQLSDYIHRVGRTARAGAVGKSLLFLLPHEADFVQVLNKEQGVRMNSKGLEELLRTLKDPKNPKKSVENAATQLQVRFERFVLSSEDNHAQAKSAYHSFVCGYSTYESSLKHIFHTKALHYGHIAKSFALRESPSAILPQQDQQSSKTGSTRASQTKLKSSVTENNMDEYFGGFVVGPRVKRRKHH